jgi:hypothetical protein
VFVRRCPMCFLISSRDVPICEYRQEEKTFGIIYSVILIIIIIIVVVVVISILVKEDLRYYYKKGVLLNYL